ncbi:MAG TPA: hypothetical protein VGF98_01095 [Candidatus Tumulicola sp.]|jgi:hypothetical protein
MAASDFLFSIGVDASQADAAVQEFVKRTNAAVASIQKVTVSSNQGAAQAIKNQNTMLTVAEKRLAVENKIADAQRRNATAGMSNGGGGLTDISNIASRNAAAVGKQKDAFDMLGRIVGNTVFKFVEYELVMKTFNTALGEVMNSLNEASNVQMEQVLQRIYNAQIDTNAALKDAIIIAKEWGSDITDVQQAIGLWTKQTSQMHDATGKLVDSQTALAAAAKLAADAEKFHRASGIDSLEVYQKSVSIWHELGLSLGQIPKLYDQIAYAATRIAPVLKAQPGTSSKNEGIRDIFEGMAESGATLRAQGMDDALIIATVAKQIENLGQTGSKVGTQVSTMFGSLNQGGKQLKEWISILGPGAFQDSEHFMDAAIANVDKLKQAQADGLLRVKPQTINTWRTFIETLQQTKDLADQIRGKSQGTLELIASAEMSTYNGQVERLKASFQELNLALGTQLLPTATRVASFLSGTLFPVLAAHSGAVIGAATSVIKLGVSYGFLLGFSRVAAMLQGTGAAAAAAAANVTVLKGAQTEAALSAQTFVNAELNTVGAVNDATAQMEREQAALQMLQAKIEAVNWQLGGFAAACEKAGVAMADVQAVAEASATRGLSAFAAGLGTIAGNAIRAIGPLAAMYAAMSALQNFDKMSRIDAAVDMGTHGAESGGKGILDTTGDIVKNPLLVPDGDAANALRDRIKANGGTMAKQLNNAMWTLYDNPHATNDDRTDAGELIKQLLAQEYNKIHHTGDVPGYDKLDQIPPWLQKLLDQAKGGNGAGMTMPGAGLGGGKKPKVATEQQIAAEAVNKDKADAMAQISKWRDTANAAEQYVKTLTKVGAANGFTEDTVKKLAAAFKTQNDAIYNGQTATEKEIKSLDAQKQHLEDLIKTHHASLDAKGNVKGGDRSSAVYAEAKAWRMADEAITKAKGNLQLYNTQKEKLKETQSTTMAEANAWSSLSANVPKHIAGVHSMPMSFLGYGDVKGVGSSSAPAMSSPQAFQFYISGLDDSLSHVTTTMGKLATAGGQVNTLKEMGATIYALYEKLKSSDPKQAAVFAQMLVEINKAGLKANQGLSEADKSLSEFRKNMDGLIGSLASKNAEDLGKLMGLDDGSVQAQKTLIDGYNSIDDSLQKIDEWVKSTAATTGGLTEADQQRVKSATQLLGLQQQLLPLLAQQEQIQNSIAYKATQSALEKAGEQVIDQSISRLMGNQNNAQTREAAYKEAISGTALSGMQSLFKDYLTNTVTAWWQQTVKNLTNSMFGDPASKARDLEQNMLKVNRDGLNDILQNTKTQVVDKLNAWEVKFAADVAKMPGATGSGSGSGTDDNKSGTQGANGQTTGAGSNTNPVAVSVVDQSSGMQLGDSTTPLAVSDAQMTATAVSAGQKVSQDMANSQSGSGYGADAGNSPLTQSGFSLISGLLGPLGAALGPILQKLEATTGGKIAGNIIGGAAQGYALGGMEQTSAGNSSDWGAVGGALGSAASMIPGIGPIIGALLPAAGGILGGLFGNHETAADEPDVYDTQNYGQFVSNMNGTTGTYNGVTINAQPQYNRADGALPMSQQMVAWAQKNPNDPLSKQILALGTSGLGIKSEYQGEFTLWNGKQISVTAYEQLGSQWQAKATGATNSPIVSINSYGGGSAAGGYNTPGMDSSTFAAEEQGWASGMSGSTGYGAYNSPVTGGGSAGGDAVVGGAAGSSLGNTQLAPYSPTATPGYGGRGSYGTATGASLTQLKLQISTPVYLDGKLLTQIVNAYNAQSRSNKGGVGAGPIR